MLISRSITLKCEVPLTGRISDLSAVSSFTRTSRYTHRRGFRLILRYPCGCAREACVSKFTFFLRQDIVQALTCFGSQGFILRLDVFSAQTQGQVFDSATARQCLPAFQMTQKHRAIDMIDDKSQIFVHICSQQHWSWRVQHSNVKI